MGSGIVLTVRRRGEKKALTFNIIREVIQVQSVKSEVIDESIGYIRLTSFNDNSSDQIEKQVRKLKNNGVKDSKIEGKESGEWKLVDGIDLIIHIFHPEKRKFYELEKIWSELIPKEKVMI